MLLITHLIFAITSLLAMLLAVIGRVRKPSGNYNSLARLSGVGFVGLVATGTALVIEFRSPILGACLQGLAYFGVLAILYVVYRVTATER
jgi:hypothetical protein